MRKSFWLIAVIAAFTPWLSHPAPAQSLIPNPPDPRMLSPLTPERRAAIADKEAALPPGEGARVVTGITFSDNLRVREAPGVGSATIEKLPSLTPVRVYEIHGSGTLSNGVLDRWLRIGENRWVNAYYVALLPFFTRTSGRIDALSELKYDITDCPDIREIQFQLNWIDTTTGNLILEPYYGSCPGYPLYGKPELPPARDIRMFIANAKLRLSEYAQYSFCESLYDIFPYSVVRYYGFMDEEGTPIFFSMQEMDSADYTYAVKGKNTLVVSPHGYGGESFSFDVYIVDSRTCAFSVKSGGRDNLIFLRTNGSGPDYRDYLEGNARVTERTARDFGYLGESSLIGIVSGYADTPRQRIEKLWPLAKECVEKGCLVNYSDLHGQSVLHYAAAHWDSGLIDFLVARGADPFFKDMDGKMPIDCVSDSHWPDNATSPDETRKALNEAMGNK